MTTREKILEAIRQSKPAAKRAPALPAERSGNPASLFGTFCSQLLTVGAEWIKEEEIEEWPAFLSTYYSDAKRIVTSITELQNLGVEAITPTEETAGLWDIDVAILEGSLGVAENGAIWLPEDQLPHRVLPFITQHLIIRLSRELLVANMHEAYQSLSHEELGFGLFVAGPSKTADIEQSLVKGAQGARTALVVLYE